MSNLKSPKIHKAKTVRGKTLLFREVEVADAEFILSLRSDPSKSLHLSKTSEDLSEQRDWLRKYKCDETQAYFIISYNDAPIGTVRLYDPQNSSFCWGSWILSSMSPAHGGIESALIVYAYAVDHLGFEQSHFDVRKENARVCRFHERFGAERIGESARDYIYSISNQSIRNSMLRYKKYLDSGITITW